MKIIRKLLISIFVLIFAIVVCNTVSATNYTVNEGDIIQTVVNGANAGDNIIINTGTYYQNVNVNTNLNIIANGSVTINAGGSGSCFHVYAGSTTIQGFNLTGATQNGQAGIYLDSGAPSCNILQNTMFGNWGGMFVWSSFNQIHENIIIDNNRHGIRIVSGSGNNNIYSNIINHNNLNNAGGSGTTQYGGITYAASAAGHDTVAYNVIVGNLRNQLYDPDNTITAINNWWGSNSAPSGISGATYSPWLILGITADPYSIYNGQTSNVTADLNHNSALQDISYSGHVKDGIPITFVFTGTPLGSLDINPANTLNGFATTTFTANAVGTSRINATLNSANVHTASNEAQTPCDIQIGESSALELNKTVDNSSPMVHDTILYTLIVQNHGPDAATSVNVTDVLPLGGLNFVGVDFIDHGTYENGVWNITNLPADSIAHLVLRFTVERAGTIENRATVSSLTWDPELYPQNRTVTINAQTLPDTTVNTQTTVNAQNLGQTVGMQETGMPIIVLLVALVMLVTGILYSNKKG